MHMLNEMKSMIAFPIHLLSVLVFWFSSLPSEMACVQEFREWVSYWITDIHRALYINI